MRKTWLLLSLGSLALPLFDAQATSIAPTNAIVGPVRTVQWSKERASGRLLYGQVIPPPSPRLSETLRVRNRTDRSRTYKLATIENLEIKKPDWVVVFRSRCRGTRKGCIAEVISYVNGKKLRARSEIPHFAEGSFLLDAWGTPTFPFHANSLNVRPERVDIFVTIPPRSAFEVGPARLFEGASATKFARTAAYP